MRRRIAMFAAAAAAAAGLMALDPALPEFSPDLMAPCHEDEPCWDCETMGNRVCGPERGGRP